MFSKDDCDICNYPEVNVTMVLRGYEQVKYDLSSNVNIVNKTAIEIKGDIFEV